MRRIYKRLSRFEREWGSKATYPYMGLGQDRVVWLEVWPRSMFFKIIFSKLMR